MQLSFVKYHGTGNDFIVIDNRKKLVLKTDIRFIKRLCDRRFGIGADGLMLLENHHSADFDMVYFNSDGNLSSMCGNGGRCIVHFAQHIGVIGSKAEFMAPDGLHKAECLPDGNINLSMRNVAMPKVVSPGFELQTGSPHLVVNAPNVAEIDVRIKGRAFRNDPAYVEAGINVNFMQRTDDDELTVRTYERGVEDETFSCGTGVTACAITAAFLDNKNEGKYIIHTLGGSLSVSFQRHNTEYKNIWLSGPATKVFEGVIDLHGEA